MPKLSLARIKQPLGKTLPLRLLPLLAACWLSPLQAQELVADPGDRSDSTPYLIATDAQPAPSLSRMDGDGFVTLSFAPHAGQDGVAWMVVKPRQGSWNWQQVQSLRMHLQNIMPWPLTVLMQLRDAKGQVLDASFGLPPSGPFQLSLPLHATQPLQMGMRAAPPMPWRVEGVAAGLVPTVEGNIDRSAITELRIGMPNPDAEQKIRLGKIFLPDAGQDDVKATYTAIVDAWGQYTRAEWPGKYIVATPENKDEDAQKDDKAAARKKRKLTAKQRKAAERKEEQRRQAAYKAEMAAFARFARAEEQALNKALSAQEKADEDSKPVELDRYGGFKGIEGATQGSGYFRTGRMVLKDGSQRHILLTPEGNPFFSLGVNAVQRDNSETFIGGREFQFSSLPEKDSPLHQFRRSRDSTEALAADSGAQRNRRFLKGESFDFYQANLYRRDGESWAKDWVSRTQSRLLSWGFNTAGAWSDESIMGARIPHTRILHVDGPFARLSDGNNWWSGIPDPFDPAFGKALDMKLRKAALDTHNDRWLIGWFVDNELGWGDGASEDPAVRYALALSALRMDAASPNAHAKRAFVKMLRERYDGKIEELARAWQQPVKTWDEIEGAVPDERLPDGRQPMVAADLSAFLRLHAESYYSQVAGALKKHAPNHLYLGSRFASRTPEAMAACARWCDVMSFNLYIPNLREGFEHEAFSRLDKPALLTEFHFGSTDRGPFWPGVMSVNTEAERGPAYRKMLESVLANPQFVGAHWFQYLDQPVTGRWLDGENGHLGLVAITDVPWKEFVLSVHGTHRDIRQSLIERIERVEAASPEDEDRTTRP